MPERHKGSILEYTRGSARLSELLRSSPAFRKAAAGAGGYMPPC